MPVLTKINTNVIADNAVTAAKIPEGAVAASEIATGSVSGADIGYLGDGSGDLTGTVSSQQLHLADAFTLTGDLTVNDDLILGKLRDDGTGQTLTHTAATNRTLTGTGTLTMGSSVEGEPKNRTDERLTVLGSAVTQATGYTLGSGVTFPSGMPYKISTISLGADSAHHSSTSYGTLWAPIYTPTKACKIYATLCMMAYFGGASSGGNARGSLRIAITSTGNTTVTQDGTTSSKGINHGSYVTETGGGMAYGPHTYSTVEWPVPVFTTVNTNPITFTIAGKAEVSGADVGWSLSGNGADTETHLKIMEVEI
jgi:hypothetical protein